MAMLRLTWRTKGNSPRLLRQEEFIEEVSQMAQRDFADAPSGPVVVEALDDESTVRWRCYYKSAAGLGALLQQLLTEGEIARSESLI